MWFLSSHTLSFIFHLFHCKLPPASYPNLSQTKIFLLPKAAICFLVLLFLQRIPFCFFCPYFFDFQVQRKISSFKPSEVEISISSFLMPSPSQHSWTPFLSSSNLCWFLLKILEHQSVFLQVSHPRSLLAIKKVGVELSVIVFSPRSLCWQAKVGVRLLNVDWRYLPKFYAPTYPHHVLRNQSSEIIVFPGCWTTRCSTSWSERHITLGHELWLWVQLQQQQLRASIFLRRRALFARCDPPYAAER